MRPAAERLGQLIWDRTSRLGQHPFWNGLLQELPRARRAAHVVASQSAPGAHASQRMLVMGGSGLMGLATSARALAQSFSIEPRKGETDGLWANIAAWKTHLRPKAPDVQISPARLPWLVFSLEQARITHLQCSARLS